MQKSWFILQWINWSGEYVLRTPPPPCFLDRDFYIWARWCLFLRRCHWIKRFIRLNKLFSSKRQENWGEIRMRWKSIQNVNRRKKFIQIMEIGWAVTVLYLKSSAFKTPSYWRRRKNSWEKFWFYFLNAGIFCWQIMTNI